MFKFTPVSIEHEQDEAKQIRKPDEKNSPQPQEIVPELRSTSTVAKIAQISRGTKMTPPPTPPSPIKHRNQGTQLGQKLVSMYTQTPKVTTEDAFMQTSPPQTPPKKAKVTLPKLKIMDKPPTPLHQVRYVLNKAARQRMNMLPEESLKVSPTRTFPTERSEQHRTSTRTKKGFHVVTRCTNH
ncbi:hypothetical protein D5018_01300 [Parashewanella curva]|uniref:Uncharacterized protein n=2 Tax=Parashewanella curva TaxID=2338552 RepID=A0A3L8Q3R9_9GAMM|nr:hypothetical protein D5018_01300 [Parashewanella curva]